MKLKFKIDSEQNKLVGVLTACLTLSFLQANGFRHKCRACEGLHMNDRVLCGMIMYLTICKHLLICETPSAPKLLFISLNQIRHHTLSLPNRANSPTTKSSAFTKSVLP